jgi:taurine dioxygenase
MSNAAIQQRRSSYRFIDVEPLAGSLGAEISGVDLAKDFSDDVMAEIRAASRDHLVIFFRDQELTPAQHIHFARRWGEILFFPLAEGIEGHPEILEVKKTPSDKKNVGGFWHSDQMFQVRPAMVSLLYGRIVPAYGGDTMFCNQYMAYETLSPAMRQMLSGLRTVSQSAHLKKGGGEDAMGVGSTKVDAAGTGLKIQDSGRARLSGSHPLVRVHPETGRKTLFISNGHTHGFEDMTEAESKPLLDFLKSHSTQPEHTCRFRWRKGSLAVWDNRCTQHLALNDYPNELRLMHRITIQGDEPIAG